jgi:glycosyltransferase involved in cell wall biosynthesis
VKVLTDLHHGVLFEALGMLFEDRLGWQLAAWEDGHYLTGSVPPTVDFPPRRIYSKSTALVKEWRPDFVIATAGSTRGQMMALAQEVGAVYVDQVGNAWDEPLGRVVLRSVTGNYGIAYHPEFHRVAYQEPSGRRVGSFHAWLATAPCRRVWDRAQREIPDAEFILYGTAEHPLFPYQVAGAMRDCAVIWHDKEADGYGFTVHEAFASGRPVIGHNHYEGKLAEPLWIDGETCIVIKDEATAVDRLREALVNPIRMGLSALAHFESLIDFDAEAVGVRDYLLAAR